MAQCMGCGTETTMERIATDAPGDSGAEYLRTRANEGQRASGYVPLCPNCSRGWDEDRPAEGSVSDGGVLSAPPHSAEQNPNPVPVDTTLPSATNPDRGQAIS